MNKTKLFYGNGLLTISKIFLTCFVFMLIFCSLALAQIDNPKEAELRASGAIPVFSGNYTFAVSNEPQVLRQGRITVTGPGYIGLITKEEGTQGPNVLLYKVEEGQPPLDPARIKSWPPSWVPYTLGSILVYSSGGVYGEDSFTTFKGPRNLTAGTTTFDVWVTHMDSLREGLPPISIEYQLWFFSQDGGRIDKVVKYGPKGEEIDEPNYEIPKNSFGVITSGKIYDEAKDKWLKPGDPVFVNQFYHTNETEGANIKFSDSDSGDTGNISVKPKTKIKPINRPKPSSGIFLVFGRIWSLFKGKKNGYAVETLNSALGVEGTEFGTAYDPVTGKTTVTVWEGVVSLKCTNNDSPPIMVNAGMQATMGNDCNPTLSALGPDNNTPAKAGWDVNVEPDVIDDQPDGTRLYPIADNYVYAYSYSGWNMANWGKHVTLGAGWNPTGGESRAYIKFDLTGIDPESVDKATLKLYHFDTGGSNAIELGVYRVMSQWTEGNGTYNPSTRAASGELSWVNQPSVDQYPVVYFNPGPGINKWVEVDVTSLIKAWLTGVPNYGLAIKGGENYIGKAESQYAFRSREFEDVEKRPVLVIYKK